MKKLIHDTWNGRFCSRKNNSYTFESPCILTSESGWIQLGMGAMENIKMVIIQYYTVQAKQFWVFVF